MSLGTALPGTSPTPDLDQPSRQARAAAWFSELRDRLCAAFESIEVEYAARQGGTPGRFQRKEWERGGSADVGGVIAGSEEAAQGGGGGTMAVMRGQVFEKVGVNVSTVFGEFSAEFRSHMTGAADDPRFWASGISVVSHPLSPLLPTAHMNTRHIVTTVGWFGGGGDLTPMLDVDRAEDAPDRLAFHAAFRAACERADPAYYPRFKAWCDEYFMLKHRGEARGVGGIFFDAVDTGDWERDFAFVQDVGRAFLDAYPQILRRRLFEPWTPALRQEQLVRRGRYVEFNLLYDRGTLFGLKTGGNIEAILMSLPPAVAWP